MYEPNTWAQTPTWAVGGSELLPALELCHDSQAAPTRDSRMRSYSMLDSRKSTRWNRFGGSVPGCFRVTCRSWRV